MAKGKKVPVSMRALHARINRMLAKEDEVLVKARGIAAEKLGDWYTISVSTAAARAGRNSVLETDVDPEKLGRELGVLREWEEVVE